MGFDAKMCFDAGCPATIQHTAGSKTNFVLGTGRLFNQRPVNHSEMPYPSPAQKRTLLFRSKKCRPTKFLSTVSISFPFSVFCRTFRKKLAIQRAKVHLVALFKKYRNGVAHDKTMALAMALSPVPAPAPHFLPIVPRFKISNHEGFRNQ